MLLPLESSLDPRKPESPVWSIQNLLNFAPTRDNAFIIARAHDPFDKNVQRDADGQVMATAGNPYALTFDPNYVYAPNQGHKLFAGIRYAIPKTGK